MHREIRKSLVYLTPKSFLRLRTATSIAKEFAPGISFNEVLNDDTVKDVSKISHVLICAGKIFYNLNQHRQKHNREDLAIIRCEQLCPFPTHQLHHIIYRYPQSGQII